MEKCNDRCRAVSVAWNFVRLPPFLQKRILLRPVFFFRLTHFLNLLLLLSLAPLFFFAPHCLAQSAADKALEYPIKAAFLYKFCLYVDWPAAAFSNADSPIILGIAAPDVMVDELSATVRERSINNRKLEVHRIDQTSNLSGVHLLFVARSETSLLHEVAIKAQNAPLLLVTEENDGLDAGAGINFILKDNKIRFDVALDTTNRQGLHLSAQLLKVAHDVRGEHSR